MLDPVTREIDSLLPSNAKSGGWRNTAIIGGPWESDGSLAFGFFEVAEIAVEHWKAGRRNDATVLPIIYLYRHGIELALKEAIRDAAACLRGDGVADVKIQADKLDDWIANTHSIERLVNRLTRLLGRLKLGPGNQLPAETLYVLSKLHVLDHDGQAFRYSTMKVDRNGVRLLEPVRPGEQRFDIVVVAEALHEAGTMVLYGVSGVLGDYSDYQADMRHDAGL